MEKLSILCVECSKANLKALKEKTRKAETGWANTQEALEHAEEAIRQHELNAKRLEEALELKDKQLADM